MTMTRDRRVVSRVAFVAAASAILALLGFASLPYWVSAFIYRPTPLTSIEPAHWGIVGARFVTFGSDGDRIAAWWAPPKTADDAVILVVHGRSANISTRAGIMRRLTADGFGVLMFDYRGYGASTGTPTERGLTDDTVAAYDWIRSQKVAPGKIVVAGQSLGNAPAARLAATRQIAVLVLVSPFTSLPGAASDRFPWLPFARLPWPKNRFDVVSQVKQVRIPVILVASTADGMVPIDNSEAVGKAAAHVRWIRADRLGHDGLMENIVESGRLTAALRQSFHAQ